MIAKSTSMVAGGFAGAVLITILAVMPSGGENWPAQTVSTEAKRAADDLRDEYIEKNISSHLRAQMYGSDGDYLNYGRYVSHSPSERLKRDSQELPMSLVAVDMAGNKEWQYVPGTLANFALAAHGRYVLHTAAVETFLNAAAKLKDIQGPDGAMRNHYRFRHYTMPAEYPLGWISGMDQGLALSVFYRAYKLSNDQSYLEAGNRALTFMQRRYPDGPMNTLADLDPSLDGYIWFDEYLADPNVYTLNGYMFALLGLYDWSHTGSQEARHLFERGVVSLEKILPYFDIGSFSAYDLSFITNDKQKLPHFGLGYHGLHIAQLQALYSITGNPAFEKTAKRWLDYIDQSGK